MAAYYSADHYCWINKCDSICKKKQKNSHFKFLLLTQNKLVSFKVFIFMMTASDVRRFLPRGEAKKIVSFFEEICHLKAMRKYSILFI